MIRPPARIFTAVLSGVRRLVGWRLLNHKEDRRPVVFMLVFVLYQFLVFALVDRPLLAFALIAIPYSLLHIALMNVMHFATHGALFRYRSLELAFSFVCSLALGFTRSCFRFDHLAHHRHYLNPEKDSNRHIETGACRRQRYALRHLLTVYPRSWRMARQASPRARFEYRVELVVLLLVIAALLATKPSVATAVFIIPMAYNIFAVYYWSHYQHADLDTTDPLTASRTYEGKVFNWITFNVGYHAAHHYRPGVHWSKLPELHASLRNRIPKELILDSVPWFSSSYPDR